MASTLDLENTFCLDDLGDAKYNTRAIGRTAAKAQVVLNHDKGMINQLHFHFYEGNGKATNHRAPCRTPRRLAKMILHRLVAGLKYLFDPQQQDRGSTNTPGMLLTQETFV